MAMTVFAKKRFAFANPDATGDKNREFIIKDQEFTYNLPEELRKDDYFKACVVDGDITVIGIIDGGEVTK